MTSDHGSETGRQNIPAAGSAHTNESRPPVNWWLAQPLKGAITGRGPKGAQKVWHRILITGSRSRAAVFFMPSYSCYP